MYITFQENKLDTDTYLELRDAVNWKKLTPEQAKKALKNSLYIVVAYDGETPIGMGRIVGDGAVICYVQDLIVHPKAQGLGIGSQLIKKLREYVIEEGCDDSTMMFALMCAKGREEFYIKNHFTARPNENLGPGMIQYLTIKA